MDSSEGISGMRVKLEVPQYGGWILHDLERPGYSFLVQWDYETPWLADNLGCDCICPCGYTDGTVSCRHMSALDMIERASDWLFGNDGSEFDAPELDEYAEYFQPA